MNFSFVVIYVWTPTIPGKQLYLQTYSVWKRFNKPRRVCHLFFLEINRLFSSGSCNLFIFPMDGRAVIPSPRLRPLKRWSNFPLVLIWARDAFDQTTY